MKTKQNSLRNYLVLALVCIPTMVMANGINIGGIQYLLDATTGTAAVTYQGNAVSENNYTGHIIVPDTVVYDNRSYAVNSIAPNSFNGSVNLLSVQLPDQITTIGKQAFSFCENLTDVNIPKSLETMADYAFFNCPNLRGPIVIPTGLMYIGGSVFSYCNSIDTIFWNAVNAWPTQQYPLGYDGIAVKSIVFGDSVQSIHGELGAFCDSITNVVIPNSVSVIGGVVFSYCDNLQTVTFGANATLINGFNYCSGLTDIYSYAKQVPSIQLKEVSRSVRVWVPADMEQAYRTTSPWKDFDIRIMQADSVTANMGLALVPGNRSVSMTWQTVEGAETYLVEVTDRNKAKVCDLIFDAGGLLQSVQYAAPARSGVAQQGVQNEAFQYTVMNLHEGTRYYVTLTANDSLSVPVTTTTATCRTTGGTDPISFAVLTNVNDTAFGEVTGGGEFGMNEQATLQATAYPGYRFAQWQDGVSANPRTVTVTRDTVFTAIFEPLPMYTLTVYSSDETMGTVSGEGEYMEGTVVTIEALPNNGYRFIAWDDQARDNPRSVLVREDMTFTAYFAQIEDGIEETHSDDAFTGTGTPYNILGQPVDENYHGIVIQNGQKRVQ